MYELPHGMTMVEWLKYCRTRQRELFPGDLRHLHYDENEPATATVAEILRAKGLVA